VCVFICVCVCVCECVCEREMEWNLWQASLRLASPRKSPIELPTWALNSAWIQISCIKSIPQHVILFHHLILAITTNSSWKDAHPYASIN